MNKKVTEIHIIEWISSLGSTKAVSVGLDDVRRLVDVLFVQEHGSDDLGGPS